MTRAILKEFLAAGTLVLLVLGLWWWNKATAPSYEPPPIVLSPPPEVATASPEPQVVETPMPRPYQRPCKTDDACLALVLRVPASTRDVYCGYDAAVMSSAERAARKQRLARRT